MRKLLTAFAAPILAFSFIFGVPYFADAGYRVAFVAGQILGTATNDSAAAGNVGELLTAQTGVGAPVALTSNTNTTIASVTLTPGEWDLSCIGKFNPAATTTVTGLQISITTGTTYGIAVASTNEMAFASFAPGNTFMSLLAPPVVAKVSTSTTYNCVTVAIFGTSTMNGSGFLRARRVR